MVRPRRLDVSTSFFISRMFSDAKPEGKAPNPPKAPKLSDDARLLPPANIWLPISEDIANPDLLFSDALNALRLKRNLGFASIVLTRVQGGLSNLAAIAEEGKIPADQKRRLDKARERLTQEHASIGQFVEYYRPLGEYRLKDPPADTAAKFVANLKEAQSRAEGWIKGLPSDIQQAARDQLGVISRHRLEYAEYLIHRYTGFDPTATISAPPEDAAAVEEKETSTARASIEAMFSNLLDSAGGRRTPRTKAEQDAMAAEAEKRRESKFARETSDPESDEYKARTAAYQEEVRRLLQETSGDPSVRDRMLAELPWLRIVFVLSLVAYVTYILTEYNAEASYAFSPENDGPLTASQLWWLCKAVALDTWIKDTEAEGPLPLYLSSIRSSVEAALAAIRTRGKVDVLAKMATSIDSYELREQALMILTHILPSFPEGRELLLEKRHFTLLQYACDHGRSLPGPGVDPFSTEIVRGLNPVQKWLSLLVEQLFEDERTWPVMLEAGLLRFLVYETSDDCHDGLPEERGAKFVRLLKLTEKLPRNVLLHYIAKESQYRTPESLSALPEDIKNYGPSTIAPTWAGPATASPTAPFIEDQLESLPEQIPVEVPQPVVWDQIADAFKVMVDRNMNAYPREKEHVELAYRAAKQLTWLLPTSSAMKAMYASIARQLGNIKEAEEVVRGELNTEKGQFNAALRAEVAFALAEGYGPDATSNRETNVRAAIALMRKGLELAKRHPAYQAESLGWHDLYRTLCDLHQRIGEDKKALETALEWVATSQAKSVFHEPLEAVAKISYKMGDYQRSLEYYSLIERQFSDEPMVYVRLAECLINLDRRRDALQTLDFAYSLIRGEYILLLDPHANELPWRSLPPKRPRNHAHDNRMRRKARKITVKCFEMNDLAEFIMENEQELNSEPNKENHRLALRVVRERMAEVMRLQARVNSELQFWDDACRCYQGAAFFDPSDRDVMLYAAHALDQLGVAIKFYTDSNATTSMLAQLPHLSTRDMALYLVKYVEALDKQCVQRDAEGNIVSTRCKEFFRKNPLEWRKLVSVTSLSKKHAITDEMLGPAWRTLNQVATTRVKEEVDAWKTVLDWVQLLKTSA